MAVLLLTKLAAEDVALLSLPPAALPPFPPFATEPAVALPVKAFKCDHFGEALPLFSGSGIEYIFSWKCVFHDLVFVYHGHGLEGFHVGVVDDLLFPL